MTSRCRDRSRDLLPFYANGSLEGHEARTVARHLEACADCARECDDLLALAAAIDREGSPLLDAAATEGRPSARPWFGSLPRLAAVLTSAVVAAGAFYLALHGWGGGQRSAAENGPAAAASPSVAAIATLD